MAVTAIAHWRLVVIHVEAGREAPIGAVFSCGRPWPRTRRVTAATYGMAALVASLPRRGSAEGR
jgi:hypothetical protein